MAGLGFSKGWFDIGDFELPSTAKYDRGLTRVLLNMMNVYDFIDYNVMATNTEVYFDKDDFNVIIVSTPYFEHVKRGGIKLEDLFTTDSIFLEYIQKNMQKQTVDKFQEAIRKGDYHNFQIKTPKVTIIEGMTMNDVYDKQIESGRPGAHSGYVRTHRPVPRARDKNGNIIKKSKKSKKSKNK